MAYRKCPKCKGKVPADAVRCKHCGYDGVQQSKKLYSLTGCGCKTLLLGIAALFALAVIGGVMNAVFLDTPTSTDSSKATLSEEDDVKKPEGLPGGKVELDDVRGPTTKVSYIVTLDERVESEEQLAELGNYLREKKRADRYKRAFFIYHTPDQLSGSMAYATTHFKPDGSMKPAILGYTKAQWQAMKDSFKDRFASSEVLGVWDDQNPYTGYIVAVEEDGQLYIDSHSPDSGWRREKAKNARRNGLPAYILPEDEHGEFYVKFNSGILGLANDERVFRKARRVESP